MKKIISFICAFCLIVSCSILLCGCGNDNANTVMNLSLNPKVEFILDKDNKVLSVNALNEEGNVIINGQVFVGKTADEAVEIFISVSKETGYLVTGNVKANENQIQVSFSGNKRESDKTFKKITDKIDTYLTENNIQATLNKTDGLSKEYLQKLVAECAPYLEEAKVKAMSNKELIDQIQLSRKETAELYSQQLKEAYYKAKEYAFELAKFDYLKSQVGPIQKAAIEVAETGYKGAIETIESTRKTLLLDQTSIYQVALKTVNDAKADYLNYRNYVASLPEGDVTAAMTQILANYKSALDNAQQKLENQYTVANTQLDNAKEAVTNAYNNVLSAIQNAGVNVSDYLDKMSTNATQELKNFTDKFEQNYQKMITTANNELERFTADLKNGYTA